MKDIIEMNEKDLKHLKEIEELKKSGYIFFTIPESFDINEIRVFIDNFILKERNILTSEDQDFFNAMFSLLVSLYVTRKEKYDKIIQKIAGISIRKRIKLHFVLEKAIKNTINEIASSDKELEVLKKKMLRDLLELTYNVDTCFGYLKTLIETAYDKGADKFMKENDEKTVFLTNMFSFIYFERPFHFDNLLELFSFELPEVSKEKVDFFKENIIKNIGYKEIENLNEIQRYKLAKKGRNEYQIFGENVVLTIDMVRDYLAV